MTKIANVKADPDNILKMRCSGLVKYLFGDDLKGKVSKQDFENIQKEVIDNILRLEYKSYCPSGNKLTEVEFCRQLLYSSNFTEKKKERLLKRVAKKQEEEREFPMKTLKASMKSCLEELTWKGLCFCWTLKVRESIEQNLQRLQSLLAITTWMSIWSM